MSCRKEVLKKVLGLAWIALLLPAFGGGGGGGTGDGGGPGPGPGPEPEVVWRGLGDSSWGLTHLQPVPRASASGGGISNSAGQSEFPSPAVDRSGNVFVAWADGPTTPAPTVYVIQ